MAGSEVARLIAELSLSDKLTPGVKKATGSLGKLETATSRVGRGAGQMASGFAKAGTRIAAGVGIGLAGAAKAAIDWEDAFAGVRKTVNTTESDFTRISDELRKMSTTMPTTAIELAAIAEAGGQMGISADEIVKFTEQVAILGSTTNVSVDEAALSLGQMKVLIGLTGDEFDNFAASLVALGNAGTSTESSILEITRRAGGAAKLFGIATEETAGWAAAVANLGLNEEEAGTNLSKAFIKSTKQFVKGSEAIQKVTGQTAKEIKQAYEKDASGALQSLIEDISKLDKAARIDAIESIFGKGSGIFKVINGLADSYKNNLIPTLDLANESFVEGTAAQEEFAKRNATVKSAITRLKNGVIDAGVTIGEGFVDDLGRASTKLAEFLGQDANRSKLREIGQDIGKVIGDIDWKEVVDGAKSLVTVMEVALGFAKKLYDAFNLLPTPLKGAVVGLAALDKLSGGLVGAGAGGIAGGIGQAITTGLKNALGSAIPGFDKAFVQRVWVVNMGAGMGGGVPGAAGGGTAAGAGALVLPVAVGVLASAAAQAAVTELNKGTGLDAAAPKFGMLDQAVSGLHNIVELIKVVTGQKPPVPKADPETLARLAALRDQADRTKDDTVAATEKVTRATAETKREAARGLALVKSQTTTSGQAIQGTTRSSAAGIEAAVRASRPIINVDVGVSATTINHVTTKVTRSGPSGGSRNRDSADSPIGPN